MVIQNPGLLRNSKAMRGKFTLANMKVSATFEIDKRAGICRE
jgi:hypothetical protein